MSTVKTRSRSRASRRDSDIPIPSPTKPARPTLRDPTFDMRLWLRLHGVDLATLAFMGILGLALYDLPPAPNRSFPLYFADGSMVYPEFAYPMRVEIVPIWLAAVLSFTVPCAFFSLCQIRRRSMDDFLTTNMGLLRALVTAAVFQVWLKWLIGGLRPHFYEVCKPNVAVGALKGAGFGKMMYDRRVCTGDVKDINDSLESFPSGHTTAAFAGFGFLALYINAQLKVMSAHNPAYWKMVLFFAPLLGATLIGGALTIDGFHNWYDVLAGGVIGSLCALVAFRQTFAAVWDFRFNHVLLPRTTSLLQRTPQGPGSARPFFTYEPTGLRTQDLPVTREGGWGWGLEGSVGAPGDASVLMHGPGAAVGGSVVGYERGK